MFGKLFHSRRSTAAGPRPEFKSGPLPSAETATKPPSKLISKLQELKQALHPRRSSQKQQRDKQDNEELKQGKRRRASDDEYIGSVALGPRLLPPRPRLHRNSSADSGFLLAGAASATGSATPESVLSIGAPSASPAPTTQAPARAPPLLQRPISTSELVEDYPQARKRIIELRAMKEKENLQLDGTQGPQALHSTRRVQVVAPLTTTTIQQSSWEFTALEFAKKQTTPAANLDGKEKQMTEERSRLNPGLGVYHSGSKLSLPTVNKSEEAESFSYKNAVHTPGPNPGLWLGQMIYEEPAPKSKPVQKRSPLLDAAPVRFDPKRFEGHPRRQNIDFFKHWTAN